MLIAALLPDAFRARLIDAVHDLRGTVLPAQDWQHLDQLLREELVSVVVVDPLIDKAIAVTKIVRLLQRWPSLPIIAYSHLTAESSRALALLSRQGLREVVLYQYDDNRVRFSHAIRRASAHRIVARLRSSLYERLTTLPIDIASVVDDLFDRPYAFQTGNDIITASTVPSSTLHLHLQQAGLAPPRRLFLTARVAHAASYLRDQGMRVQDVASKLGYSSPEILTRHTMQVLGVRPRQLRYHSTPHGVTDDDIISRLLVWAQYQSHI